MSAAAVNARHHTSTGGIVSEEHESRDHTRVPIVVGDVFFFGPLDAEAEVEGGVGLIFKAVLDARRNGGQLADDGQVYVDGSGEVRPGVGVGEPTRIQNVGQFDSRHDCCAGWNHTMNSLDEHPPLSTWPSLDLLYGWEHMKPHGDCATAPSHMEISLAFFREIATRAQASDSDVLDRSDRWASYTDLGDELGPVIGQDVDAVMRSSKNLDLRTLLDERASQQASVVSSSVQGSDAFRTAEPPTRPPGSFSSSRSIGELSDSASRIVPPFEGEL